MWTWSWSKSRSASASPSANFPAMRKVPPFASDAPLVSCRLFKHSDQPFVTSQRETLSPPAESGEFHPLSQGLVGPSQTWKSPSTQQGAVNTGLNVPLPKDQHAFYGQSCDTGMKHWGLISVSRTFNILSNPKTRAAQHDRTAALLKMGPTAELIFTVVSLDFIGGEENKEKEACWMRRPQAGTQRVWPTERPESNYTHDNMCALIKRFLSCVIKKCASS